MASGEQAHSLYLLKPELSGHSPVLTSSGGELACMVVAQCPPPFPGQGEPVCSKSGRLPPISKARSISKTLFTLPSPGTGEEIGDLTYL